MRFILPHRFAVQRARGSRDYLTCVPTHSIKPVNLCHKQVPPAQHATTRIHWPPSRQDLQTAPQAPKIGISAIPIRTVRSRTSPIWQDLSGVPKFSPTGPNIFEPASSAPSPVTCNFAGCASPATFSTHHTICWYGFIC